MMKSLICTLSLIGLVPSQAQFIANPAIDYPAFKKLVVELEPVREKHRVTVDQFLQLASEPNTVILDARNETRYDAIHVKGAVNLPFSEFSAANLAKVIPHKTTRILIYCNNNFDNEPVSLMRKDAAVSLNVPTFINLHAYGYKQVYELGPLLDAKNTKLTMIRTKAEARRGLLQPSKSDSIPD